MAEKTVDLKVRISPRQAAWLRELADERFGGNMSAALRRALADGRLMGEARREYGRMVAEQGFRFPTDAVGMTCALEVWLTHAEWFDVDSIEELEGVRRLEESGG